MYRWSRASFLVLAAVFLGCGDSGDKLPTVKAGGAVTLNGQPVAGANVYFSPRAGGRAAYAVTDGRGRFRLNTSPAIPGVMPGSYSVGIAKQRSETAAPAGKDARPLPNGAKLANELPDQYRDPAKSGLTAEVKAGESNDFLFHLK